MYTSSNLLDDLKHRLTETGEINTCSDYALAKYLGLKIGRVSSWRTGRNAPSDDLCIKFASILNLPPGYILASMRYQGEKNQEVKQAWLELAERYTVHTIATLTFCALSALDLVHTGII